MNTKQKATEVSFRLRAGEDDFSGGSVSIGDGETFDVGAALDEGNGTIRVEEGSAEERALADYPVLARGEADKPKSSSKPESKE